jgi:hypothetical protein
VSIRARLSITISPICREETSVSPSDSSLRTIPDTIWSIRSGVTGPLLHGDADRPFELAAVEVLPPPVRLHHYEVAELHPFVGGEAPPAGRAEPPPPDRRVVLGGRESFTWVSTFPQKGQRIRLS